jgi:hypothetical protein
MASLAIPEPGLPQRRHDWVEAVAQWFVRGSEGIRWLLAVFVVASVFGFYFFPGDLADRNRAERVAADGQWGTTTNVNVHVGWVLGFKGTGYYAIKDVRVHLPGTVGPALLDNVDGVLPDDTDAREGWQAPTERTGYTPPLRVRYLTNARGEVGAAIAQDDLTYWTTGNNDPEVGLAIGLAGLALALAAITLNHARLTGHPGPRRRTPRAYRRTGTYTAGQRNRLRHRE